MNPPPTRPTGAMAETQAQSLARRLLGVRLISDIHERLADHGLSLPAGPQRRNRLEAIRRRRLLFIHVPKTGGTSISQMIYGLHIGHSTMRYYHAAIPDIVGQMPSFAVLRDPETRFLSAYRHARHGAAADSEICPAYREQYLALRHIDDALNHVEDAANPYAMDPIFRPQSWFLRDREGDVAVDHFERLEALHAGHLRLPYLRGPLPHLNRSSPIAVELTERQRRRLRALYAEDYQLIANIP